jgi:Tol biopolymer transport system component
MTLALCLVMVGNGIRPQVASAQTKQSRQIWLTSLNEDPSESVPSADGRYIGFTDWNTGELGIRDLTTGQTRLLTNTAGWVTSRDYAESSAISPDGRQIAYAWFTTKELTYELRVIPINGGSPRTVYRPEGKKEYPKVMGWTPDGKQVLVVRTLADGTSQLAFISVQDGSSRVLKSFSWRKLNARLSPDGRFIAYDSPPNDKIEAKDIFVIATDGSSETPVVQHPASDIMPQWSPDGSRILFVSDRTGNHSLWSVEIDNGRSRGAPVLIKAEIGGIQPLGITRPGTLLYISPGSSTFNIYTAELDADLKEVKSSGLAVERFLNSNSGPRVSPDGEQLAYLSSPTAGAVIVIRNQKTGKERDIKVPFPLWKRYGYGPMWFPDGRSVLVSSLEPQRPGISFYQVDVSTGASALVHRVPWAQGYQLSPDGRAIFFTRAETDDLSARLVRFDLDTKRETELKKGERFIAVAVSPESTYVFVASAARDCA